MPTEKQIFGKKGEEMAIDFLKKKEYKIIERNFQKRIGEIDIITYDPKFNEIVFVEVKTRHNKNFGYPEEAVTKMKIKKMKKAAEIWLLKNRKKETGWRLDVISIEIKQKKPTFYHITNISL